MASAVCVNQFIKPFGNNSERSNWNAFGYYFDQWVLLISLLSYDERTIEWMISMENTKLML